MNDAPDAANDTRTVLAASGNATLDVLVNDTNVDSGEDLTITAVTQPASGQGSVAISTDKKSLIYTPPSASFTGTVTVTYTISDSTLTDTATLTITVNNFVPRSIGGTVVLDSSASATAAYGGVDYVLSGTDITGQAQRFTVSTRNDGSFLQNNLAPGTYTISRPVLPFLENSAESMTVTSAPTDTSNTSLKSAIGSLKAQYISIRDFLGSAAANSVMFAVSPGSGESWYAVRSGWTGFSNIQGRLDAAATTLTVTATNASNQNVSTALPLSGAASKVSVLATEGDTRLLRVTGAPGSLNFQVVTTTSSASGEGEGGSSLANSKVSSSSNGLVAEGEAAPEIVSASNNRNGMSSPSQVLRQMLGSNLNSSSSSLVTATTNLQPGAVDSALSEIDTISLASSEVDQLTSASPESDDIDSALLAM